MPTPSESSHDESCSGQCVSAAELIGLYYNDPEQLGTFERVESELVPAVYRQLLDHTNHMTVTVESFHGERVDVQVLRSELVGEHYRREILLKKHSDHRVVQYGIVRLNTKYLADKPRNEILAQSKPLGRVLIEHNVLREIELFDLFKVTCGPILAELFGVDLGAVTYGRTALIYCDNDPAIELLEIVRP
jgi:chorismate-pyruvate lyase